MQKSQFTPGLKTDHALDRICAHLRIVLGEKPSRTTALRFAVAKLDAEINSGEITQEDLRQLLGTTSTKPETRKV